MFGSVAYVYMLYMLSICCIMPLFVFNLEYIFFLIRVIIVYATLNYDIESIIRVIRLTFCKVILMTDGVDEFNDRLKMLNCSCSFQDILISKSIFQHVAVKMFANI